MELDAMRGVPVTLDAGQYDEKLAGTVREAAELPESDEPSWEQDDTAMDSVVARDAEVLTRRSQLLNDAYPFALAPGGLAYRGSSTLVYEFCLCTSLAGNLTRGGFARIPRTFERMAGQLAAAYLGPHGRCYRLGWPPLTDRPRKLRDAIRELHLETGGWVWQALPALNNDQGPRNVKDGGIDLVVWQPFGDQRVGQLFLLGQCACGNDWPDKLRDLDPEAFSLKWLRVMSYARDVIRFIAIPRHVPDEVDWVNSCATGGLLLDRIRLTLLAIRASSTEPGIGNLRAELLPLIRLMLPQFVDLQAASS
jgi:hypothetical protein